MWTDLQTEDKLVVTSVGVEREGIIYEWGHGRYKPLGVRYVQGCIVQHRNIANILYKL